MVREGVVAPLVAVLTCAQPQKNTPKKPLQVKTLNGFKYAPVTEDSGYT